MPETPADHELKRFGCTRGVSRDHRAFRHDLGNRRCPWVERFSGDLTSALIIKRDLP